MALSIPGTSLPPRHYRDQIAASNYDGVNILQDAKPPGDQLQSRFVDPQSPKGSSSTLVIDKEPKANSQSLTKPPLGSKSKFISCSLPNSASSTPRVGTTSKKNWSYEIHASPTHLVSLARQDSEAFLFLGSWKHDHLQKSSSGGEGRVSTNAFDDIDIISPKVSSREFSDLPTLNPPAASSYYVFPPRTDAKKNIEKRGKKSYYRKCFYFGPINYGKCCWYMPNFGREKPVNAKNYGNPVHAISDNVSLEKFECGSWVESGVVNESENSVDSNNYFDLPLELIREGVRDAISPVRSAFYFDKDASKGSRKNMSTRRSYGSRSSSSSYHTIIISPRLQKARHDFNALLEAQRS